MWFFHDGSFDWIVIAVVGLLYVAFGDSIGRSSWVVLGAWGILQTATHFAAKWSDYTLGAFFPFGFLLFPFNLLYSGEYGPHRAHPWAGPVAYALAGLLFIGLAVRIARRRHLQEQI